MEAAIQRLFVCSEVSEGLVPLWSSRARPLLSACICLLAAAALLLRAVGAANMLPLRSLYTRVTAVGCSRLHRLPSLNTNPRLAAACTAELAVLG